MPSEKYCEKSTSNDWWWSTTLHIKRASQHKAAHISIPGAPSLLSKKGPGKQPPTGKKEQVQHKNGTPQQQTNPCSTEKHIWKSLHRCFFNWGWHRHANTGKENLRSNQASNFCPAAATLTVGIAPSQCFSRALVDMTSLKKKVDKKLNQWMASVGKTTLLSPPARECQFVPNSFWSLVVFVCSSVSVHWT